jgi:hypothetical protein
MSEIQLQEHDVFNSGAERSAKVQHHNLNQQWGTAPECPALITAVNAYTL